jgi:hypothetical protein
MKTKARLFVGFLLMTACLGQTSLKAGTEIFLYPFARAFGSPSESELVRCRAAFKQLQARLGTSRVVVMPVLFADAGRYEWRKDLAAVELGELAAQTSAQMEVSTSEPNVAMPPRFHNQLRYLWKRSTAYGSWIKATHPVGDYVLVTEIFGGGGKVGAIQVYLFDSSGQIAFCRLLNSHQFGPNLPLNGEDAVKLIVNTLFENLKWDAKKLFPPYGVG